MRPTVSVSSAEIIFWVAEVEEEEDELSELLEFCTFKVESVADVDMGSAREVIIGIVVDGDALVESEELLEFVTLCEGAVIVCRIVEVAMGVGLCERVDEVALLESDKVKFGVIFLFGSLKLVQEATIASL